MKKARGRTGRRRPAALSAGRSDAGGRNFLVRTWWILRGAAAGTLILAVAYMGFLGARRIVLSPALAVDEVRVEGCAVLNPGEVEALTGVRKGEPLLLVDLEEVRRRVERHVRIKKAVVARLLPSTLSVTVMERSPVAVVMDGGFAVLDGEGVVLERAAAYGGDHPIITGARAPGSAGGVAVEAGPALAVLEALTGAGVMPAENISELRVAGDRVLVSLTGTGTVLVMSPGDVHRQVRRLSLLMDADGFDGGTPGYDLRFAGRVIALPREPGTVKAAGGGARTGG